MKVPDFVIYELGMFVDRFLNSRSVMVAMAMNRELNEIWSAGVEIEGAYPIGWEWGYTDLMMTDAELRALGDGSLEMMQEAHKDGLWACLGPGDSARMELHTGMLDLIGEEMERRKDEART